MLSWLFSQNERQAKAGRGFLNVNPWDSLIFTETELVKNKELPGCKERIEDQCMHGCVHPVSKAPCRKRTRLSTNVPLKFSAKQCPGNHRGRHHGPLEGKDPNTGLPCIALSAVYPHGLVKDLVTDI